MKTLLMDLKTSLLAIIAFTVLLCGIYPFLVWGTAQVFFRDQARGSLMEKEGVVIGSTLIAQNFSAPRYFRARPSAAGKGYDAASSSGSNLGPTSQKFIDTVRSNIETYRKENNLDPALPIPADAVTSSASGLDPHISPRNAELQSPRIARERGLSDADLARLVKAHTQEPFLGFIGERVVNVMTLNRALDQASGH